MSNKLAIILTGPYRYADNVIKSLERIISEEINYDFFVHIWEEDLGNKVRDGVTLERDLLSENPNVKSITFGKAYSEADIASKWGGDTGCHSTINAMFGMFTAINSQIALIKILPDYDSYTHVLRIRTDCALFLDEINRDVLTESIIVSKNYSIPDSWVSDHLMLTTFDIFDKIWGFKNIEEFAQRFDKSGRNPEKMLADRIRDIGYLRRLLPIWIRGESYHIVYNPPKNDDPKAIVELITKEGINSVFNYVPDTKYLTNVSALNNHWKKLNQNYDRVDVRIKRFLKKLVYRNE
ncbi:hypothetical protein ACJO1P_12545 [Vibrio parahaemolyticus]|uniref:hypothetical protein n=1 Tax=Vibrio parahaemolyticus TaxID=670 RepID=UPI00387B4084